MPEGHVTHRLARALASTFGGRPVRVSSPQGRFADAAALLDGTVLEGADSVGKHLLVDFEVGTIWIHLGLIGKLRFTEEFPPPNPGTLRLRIADGVTAADLRGPQWCRLITPDERAAVVLSSGPDPIREDADPERAWKVVHRSRKPIAAVLMDQKAFAGVGNIFRAEVLYRHRIDPYLPAAELPREVFDAVWRDLVVLMRAAVDVGRIDTVFAEHTPDAMGRGKGGRRAPSRLARGLLFHPAEVCRSVLLDNLITGFRQAWRALLRRPASLLLATATLAPGIAASVTVLARVDRVLPRPLPCPQPRQRHAPGLGQAGGWTSITPREFQVPGAPQGRHGRHRPAGLDPGVCGARRGHAGGVSASRLARRADAAGHGPSKRMRMSCIPDRLLSAPGAHRASRWR